jgi:hypothetical protein
MPRTNKRRKLSKIKKHRKTQKHPKQIYILPNMTPYDVTNVSSIINKSVPTNLSSYSPTINKELIPLESIPRQKVIDCNNESAFELKEPLKIGIPGKIFGKTCYPYYDQKAIKQLLKSLNANKHIKPENIVPPIQSQSNCWFNTMFVSLFISDKGRKFFHFFRQLMIEGYQSNGKMIPTSLRNAFALLNYAIDASITGTKYAYILDTNVIIKNIYENIPKNYKDAYPYLTTIDEAGNPIRYYNTLIKYLHDNSIQLRLIENCNENWKSLITAKEHKHIPHIIILEFYDKESKMTTNKPRSFSILGARYALDSCIIRDTSKQHFCALLTAEGREMAYDGLSFHRLTKMDWKHIINSDIKWSFEGPINLEWNFKNGYQMLIYYRVK